MLILAILCTFCTLITAICPNGSVTYYTDPTLCFFFYPTRQNFMTAEGICERVGGHLTSIHSMFENVFVGEQGNSAFTDSESNDLWVGANTLMTPDTWSWMDNSAFDFTDWEKGQPQNTTLTNCGAVSIKNNLWISDDCNKKKPFVCLSKTTSPTTTTTTTTTTKPKACSPSWTYYVVNGTSGYCYKVFDNATWIDAEDNCKVYQAHLASVHTLDESLFLAYLAYWPGSEGCDGYKMAWIGGYTDDNNAHWYWTDGTPFNYTAWPNGHPSGSFQKSCTLKYVTTTCNLPASTFDNSLCERTVAKYICKKSPT